jgi:uncharacterized protein
MNLSTKSIVRAALERNPLLADFYARAQKIVPCDSAHDFSHIERVAAMTVEISTREIKSRKARDIFVSEIDDCIVAALLHDCVPVAKDSPLRKQSSQLSSDQARKWLVEKDWPEASIESICGAIRDHSFSAGFIPNTLLGEALQDADRLESLGAIGLYRVIVTGVAMGCSLFDASDPWAKNRELDDRRYSVDHFYTKLLKLPESFRTQAAREEAQKRADFLQLFLRQLSHEIS